MKKIIITLVTIMTLTLAFASPAFAGGNGHGKGPAEKATGTVGVPVRGWYSGFNAHEAMNGRPAKGDIFMWSDEVSRELELDIHYVEVDGDDAWFAALCTSDSFDTVDGKWLYIMVHDGGEPGLNGVDQIGWDWDSGTNESNAESRVNINDTPSNWWDITDGNLQVHSTDNG